MTAARPLTILAAGDLFFAANELRHWQTDPRYRLLREPWRGTTPPASLNDADRDRADIVFCEWCRHNAVFYSRRKLPHQRLIIRPLAQEINNDLLQEVVWPKVDHAVLISPEFESRFLERVPEMAGRTSVIRMSVDTAAFDQPKRHGAERNLGLLNFYGSIKGPDVALHLLERLHRADSTYRLHLKGQHPWQRAHIWNDNRQRRFARDVYAEMQRSTSADGIVVHRTDPKVAEWLTGIGIILSTSREESGQRSIMEGMASGAIPVVRGWAGADWQYPAPFVLPFEEAAFLDAAVAFIRELEDPAVRGQRQAEAQAFARQAFGLNMVMGQFDELFQGLQLG